MKLYGYLYEGKFYQTPDELTGRTFSEGNSPIPLYDISTKLPDGQLQENTVQEATDKFKIYLNEIINKIPAEIHEELWGKLSDCITEKLIITLYARNVVEDKNQEIRELQESLFTRWTDDNMIDAFHAGLGSYTGIIKGEQWLTEYKKGRRG